MNLLEGITIVDAMNCGLLLFIARRLIAKVDELDRRADDHETRITVIEKLRSIRHGKKASQCQ